VDQGQEQSLLKSAKTHWGAEGGLYESYITYGQKRQACSALITGFVELSHKRKECKA
jgi:hypothetical protein